MSVLDIIEAIRTLDIIEAIRTDAADILATTPEDNHEVSYQQGRLNAADAILAAINKGFDPSRKKEGGQ